MVIDGRLRDGRQAPAPPGRAASSRGPGHPGRPGHCRAPQRHTTREPAGPPPSVAGTQRRSGRHAGRGHGTEQAGTRLALFDDFPQQGIPRACSSFRRASRLPRRPSADPGLAAAAFPGHARRPGALTCEATGSRHAGRHPQRPRITASGCFPGAISRACVKMCPENRIYVSAGRTRQPPGGPRLTAPYGRAGLPCQI